MKEDLSSIRQNFQVYKSLVCLRIQLLNHASFQVLVNYCADDNLICLQIFKKLWPEFKERSECCVWIVADTSVRSCALALYCICTTVCFFLHFRSWVSLCTAFRIRPNVSFEFPVDSEKSCKIFSSRHCAISMAGVSVPCPLDFFFRRLAAASVYGRVLFLGGAKIFRLDYKDVYYFWDFTNGELLNKIKSKPKTKQSSITTTHLSKSLPLLKHWPP